MLCCPLITSTTGVVMNSHFAVYPSDNFMVKLCFTEMPVTLCQRDCSCFTVVYIFTVNLLCFSDAMAQIQSPVRFCDQEVSSLKLKQPLTVDTCVNPQLIWITLSFFKCTFWLMCCAESDDFTYLPFTRQTT